MQPNEKPAHIAYYEALLGEIAAWDRQIASSAASAKEAHEQRQAAIKMRDAVAEKHGINQGNVHAS